MTVQSPHPLALEFANTAGFHALEERREELHSFAELVAWAHDRQIIGRSDSVRLKAISEDDPDAAAVLAGALALRDAIQGVFSRIARHRGPSPAALALINERLTEALPNGRVAAGPRGGYVWTWDKSERLDRILWPIVKSAADLLMSDDLPRLRECAGRDCSRLFLDESKNGSRRWCSMAGCGNRAKVRRFYRRAKEKKGKA
ncbi:MAG: CGNR zinc finger domain-containing protein [Thermoanaerobaculia bacterium]